jgi:hypothetical protein
MLIPLQFLRRKRSDAKIHVDNVSITQNLIKNRVPASKSDIFLGNSILNQAGIGPRVAMQADRVASTLILTNDPEGFKIGPVTACPQVGKIQSSLSLIGFVDTPFPNTVIEHVIEPGKLILKIPESLWK